MKRLKKPLIILYGYFLKGSGSGIYVRDLTRSLNEIGTDVVLFSQESEPASHNFIRTAWEVENGKLNLIFDRPSNLKGTTVHIKADLKGFLPAFVHDPYPGYSEVREFKKITAQEMENYLTCIEEAIKLSEGSIFESPAGIISNHLVPLPVIAERMFKSVPHFVVFHGSDLNYGIRKSPLVEKFFWEGITKVQVLTLTDHGKRDFLGFAGRRISENSVIVVHPGVDTNIFRPLTDRSMTRDELVIKVNELFEDKEGAIIAAEREKIIRMIKSEVDIETLIGLYNKIDVYEAEKLTEPEFSNYLKKIHLKDPIITFTGKYLWTKGPEAVLLAAPLILSKYPEAKIILVGLGSSRGILESIREAIATRNVKLLRKLLELHYEIDPGSIQKLEIDPAEDFIRSFLEDERELKNYFSSIDPRKIRKNIYFAGYLDHSRLGLLLSMTDVFLAPSVYLESFGLVAIEAAAAGAVPVITAAYGFGDTDRILRNNISELKSLPELTLKEGFVSRLANCCIEALELPTRDLNFRLRLHNFVEKEFSWKSAATKIAGFFRKIRD